MALASGVARRAALRCAIPVRVLTVGGRKTLRVPIGAAAGRVALVGPGEGGSVTHADAESLARVG